MINSTKIKMISCTKCLVERGIISIDDFMAYTEKVLKSKFD